MARTKKTDKSIIEIPLCVQRRIAETIDNAAEDGQTIEFTSLVFRTVAKEGQGGGTLFFTNKRERQWKKKERKKD